MRIITVRQPWASLIAVGEKWVENRTWSCSYRGPVAIHAAVADDPPAWYDPLVRDVLRDRGLRREQLPHGAVVAVADLVDAHPSAGLCCLPWGHQEARVQHLMLANPRELDEPLPMVGKLGLTRLDPADVGRVLDRLPAAA